MILNKTDQVSEDTNNLVPRLVKSGSFTLVHTGTGINYSGTGTEAITASKTISLPEFDTDEIPIVHIWMNYTDATGTNYFLRLNHWNTTGGLTIEKIYYYFQKTSGVLELVVKSYTYTLLASSTYTFYYLITSASFSEVSGL